MPTIDHPVLPSELAQRAAEVRRSNAEREAQHPGLVLALSVRCDEHDAGPDALCYSPSVGGVCGERVQRAVHLARSRRGQQRSEGARR